MGESTEDAISRLLLTAEAVKKHEAAACIIVDMDKCCENVSHLKLMEAGRQHDFPLVVLRICLSMRRAARGIAWDGVFSSFVFARQTVVPGCSIALWLAQLLMISTLDDVCSQLPHQLTNVKVYVDDASIQVKGWAGEVVAAATKARLVVRRASEQGASLPISMTKGRVTASSMQMAQ